VGVGFLLVEGLVTGVQMTVLPFPLLQMTVLPFPLLVLYKRATWLLVMVLLAM
jgi:hypothetical protein